MGSLPEESSAESFTGTESEVGISYSFFYSSSNWRANGLKAGIGKIVSCYRQEYKPTHRASPQSRSAQSLQDAHVCLRFHKGVPHRMCPSQHHAMLSLHIEHAHTLPVYLLT